MTEYKDVIVGFAVAAGIVVLGAILILAAK
jgi:hypothetical protein